MNFLKNKESQAFQQKSKISFVSQSLVYTGIKVFMNFTKNKESQAFQQKSKTLTEIQIKTLSFVSQF